MRLRFGRYAVVGFLLLEAVWAVCVVYRASEGGLSIPAYILYFYGGIIFGLGFVVWVILGISTVLRDRSQLGQVISSPFLLTVFLAVSFGVGFRIRLAISKPALRTVARRTVEGAGSEEAQWVGLFHVRAVDHVSGAVRFITASCGFDDCGVVYDTVGLPPRVGEDSYYDLGGGWWHWHRSW